MQRILVEWGLYLCVGVFLAAVVLLAGSFVPAWPRECLELLDLNDDRWGHGRVFLLVSRGELSLCSDLEYDSSGSPRPEIVDPGTIILPKVQGSGGFTIPGLAVHYVRFGDGQPWWSFSVSLAIPAALSLLASALLFRRLRGIAGGMKPGATVAGEAAIQAPAADLTLP